MNLLEKFKALNPLPKPHYCWPVVADPILKDDPLLAEYARITGYMTVSPEWYSKDTLRTLRAGYDEGRYLLVAMSSPWHRTKAWKEGASPHLRGVAEREELDYFRSKFDRVLSELPDDVFKTYILDCEAWHVTPSTRKAIARKHRIFADLIGSYFGDPRILWYARGGVTQANTPTGYACQDYLTLDEPSAPVFCSAIYYGPEQERIRTIVRAVCQRVDEVPDEIATSVCLWVSLGSCWSHRDKKGLAIDGRGVWNPGITDYSVYYSWQLGWDINQKWDREPPPMYAGWDKVREIVFCPAPFNFPQWSKHFIAYCRGADGTPDLSDLEE